MGRFPNGKSSKNRSYRVGNYWMRVRVVTDTVTQERVLPGDLRSMVSILNL